jgi:hypothetical protein
MAATTTSKLEAIDQKPYQKCIPTFTQCNLSSIWSSLRCFGIQPDFGGGARDGKTTDFQVVVTTYVPEGGRRAGYGQKSACRDTKAFKWDERQAGHVRLCDLTLPSRCPTLQPCVGPVRISPVPWSPTRRTDRIATRDL